MSTVQYLQVRGNLKNSGSQGVSWPVSCRPVSEDLQQAKCPGRLATSKRITHTNIYMRIHMFTHLYIYADRYTQIQPNEILLINDLQTLNCFQEDSPHS